MKLESPDASDASGLCYVQACKSGDGWNGRNRLLCRDTDLDTKSLGHRYFHARYDTLHDACDNNNDIGRNRLVGMVGPAGLQIPGLEASAT